jgi:hypothetical protein
VLNASSSLANATVGSSSVVTGANPLIGTSLASPTQNQGSLLGLGIQSGGQPATAAVGGTSLLGGSSVLSTGTSLLNSVTH